MKKKNKARIVIWDLESTNLKGNFGYLLCGAWKVLGEKKINCVSITDSPTFEKDPTNDKHICKELLKSLEEADMWVAHFGKWFDRPMLNTRLLGHNLPPLPPIPLIDTWRIAKDNLKLNSNRLATIAAWAGLEEKTPLSGPRWIKAMAGHRPSINYVVKHCKQDCVVLEQVYEKIKCLCTNHPNVNLVDDSEDACPICGGEITKRGFTFARTRKYQRWQCKDCGGWSRSSAAEKQPKLKVR
jgi:uncharacterized protein YprB with RNaseH-like and TPR domain